MHLGLVSISHFNDSCLKKKLKTNCDLGECLNPNPDKTIMALIDMANIACGGHAGNESSMKKTINLAIKNNVKIGIHPSYIDKKNFGRVSHNIDEKKLFDDLYKQVKTFQETCLKNNANLEYIKPHGALYHDMMHKKSVLKTILKVIKKTNKSLALVVQAGIKKDEFEKISKKENIKFLYEVFADRGYNGLKMIPRNKPKAVLRDVKLIINQYKKFQKNSETKIDTICFHSDNPASVKALKKIKNV
tara:strand:+ start:3504 stop:4241 length:738 start_codon:yes stop_codon:yes gene_type:complete